MPKSGKKPTIVKRSRTGNPIYEMAQKLFDDFVEDVAINGYKDEKLTKFYDKLLSNLEKQKDISHEEAVKIKENIQSKKHNIIDEGITNKAKEDITSKEKIYYKVARFTKEIGLSKISDYFMEKIPTKKLEQITGRIEQMSTKVMQLAVPDGNSNNSNRKFQGLVKAMGRKKSAGTHTR